MITSLRTGIRARGKALVEGSIKIYHALLLTYGSNSKHKQKGECLGFAISLGL